MFETKYKKWTLLSLLATGSLFAAPTIGVVDFTACATNSKVGQFEQSNFETMKKQLGGHLEKTEKNLNELATKLNDQEYMDGLSPAAESELKEKIQVLRAFNLLKSLVPFFLSRNKSLAFVLNIKLTNKQALLFIL